MVTKHKKAYIAYFKENDTNSSLFLQYNTLATAPHHAILNKLISYFHSTYKKDESIYSISQNLYFFNDNNSPILRIMVKNQNLTDNQKFSLNKLIQDFKYFASEYEFDVSFDTSAKHLMKTYQAINVVDKLSPTVGFSSQATRLKSNAFASKISSGQDVHDEILTPQFNYFFQWEKQNESFSEFVASKNLSLNKLFFHPEFTPIHIVETPDNYLVYTSNMNEGNSRFIFEHFNEAFQADITVNTTDNGFEVYLPKNAEALYEIYALACTHKLKVVIDGKELSEEFNKITSLELFPCLDLEKEMFQYKEPIISASNKFSL